MCIRDRITGREEMVDLYQEEAEVFKEKNYHHKERVKTDCVNVGMIPCWPTSCCLCVSVIAN